MEGEMGIRKEDYDENGSLSVEKLNKRKKVERKKEKSQKKRKKERNK